MRHRRIPKGVYFREGRQKSLLPFIVPAFPFVFLRYAFPVWFLLFSVFQSAFPFPCGFYNPFIALLIFSIYPRPNFHTSRSFRRAFFSPSFWFFQLFSASVLFQPLPPVFLFHHCFSSPRSRFSARIPLSFPFSPVLKNFACVKKYPTKKTESSFIFPIDDPAVRKVRQSFEKSPHGQSRFPWRRGIFPKNANFFFIRQQKQLLWQKKYAILHKQVQKYYGLMVKRLRRRPLTA